ncbi:MAG TPA: penicillin-binding protein 1C [Kiloniellales bacterium]|nr:penicillin-binding protein 1C [Kiloniellales bacterium]
MFARTAWFLGRLTLVTGVSAAGLFLLWQIAFYYLDRDWPLDLTRLEDTSQAVVDREGRVLRAFTAEDQRWRFATTAAEVSPLYLAMLKAYEDGRFDSHYGIDPFAVGRAVGQMVWHQEVVSGASTLTMQVARLLEPRARTLASKAVEAFRALQLEKRYSKDEILGIYLTLAPFGGNLEGIRAASLSYFGKEPRVLTPAEAALLVALPQAPSLLRPDVDPAAARRARDKVLARAAEEGVISARELAEALQAPVPERRLAMPFLAPHLSEQLAAANPQAAEIETTLDYRLQDAVEQLTLPAALRLGEGVTLAVIVMDNATGAVLAHLGSADYFDVAREGMVDMTQALRSPGSALKPFIYGLAFERLVAHPDTLVADRPHRFGTYVPTNFDQAFNGEVTLAEALQRSLNVPAVMLLERVGAQRFDLRLQEVGVTLEFDRESDGPGLALALGGAGITLVDLVKLYGGLARWGQPVEPHWQPGPTQDDGPALLSDVATWYVTTVLEAVPRPLGYRLAESAGGGNRIAFKTGTSYGYRDAWAVGYNHSTTIGVWAGRADGTPCGACVGIQAAAPLLFQLFDLLPPEPAPSAFRAPPKGVIAGPTANLPPALRRLTDESAAAHLAAANAPKIAFPLDGTTLALGQGEGALQTLPLKVEGGQRPFTWLVNGVPLAERAWRGAVFWQPSGTGFTQLQVIDAKGRSAKAEVFISAE